MDHLFHPFIPGTPENMALVQTMPALIPMYNQIVGWFQITWRRLRS